MNRTKQDFKIPICRPVFTGKEKAYVLDALESTQISSNGSYIARFEDAYSSFCGTNFGIGVCNGTVALHLSLCALGIGKDDDVIVPAFTMISPVLAVVYTGARPVLVDADEETWCINTYEIEKKITKRTKAIIAVHIFGSPCNMDRINSIAKRYGLFVIEDAAEAHGSSFHGRICGSLSDISCFSFYANKIITTGEGGMVCTSSKVLADHCRSLRNLYFSNPRYLHKKIGFNYRMTNIQAAIGLAQFENILNNIAKRRIISTKYRNTLPFIHQEEDIMNYSCNWYHGMLVNNRHKLAKKLSDNGIETRPFFIGMHKQPCLGIGGKYPVTDMLTRKGILLPTGDLTNEEVTKVCSTILS